MRIIQLLNIACAVFCVTAGCSRNDVVAADKTDYVIVEVKNKPADKEWKQYQTRTLENIRGFKPDTNRIILDKYGGRTDKKAKATGFFYPTKIADRWWLIDPEGNCFTHIAIAGVYLGITEFTKQASLEHFGSDANWAQFSAKILHDYSFNGSGGWSDARLLRKTAYPPVYTLSWNFISDFASSKGLTHQVSGHMGYPDEIWPVFHPDFERYCDEYAGKLESTNNDPYCLGHFSDNELQVQIDMLDRTLKLDLVKYPEMKYNVEAAKQWLVSRKAKSSQTIDINEINDSDRYEYIGYMFDRYFAITTSAIRKHDPNHLCLGSRFHGKAKNMPLIFKAAGKYLDVVSVNYYNAWTPDQNLMNMWVKESSRPFLITEWYAKGMDSGLPNVTGAGWVVKTQQDRAKFYENFTLGLMQNKNCVGWHWFKFLDNNPEDVNAEPSNRDSNKGVINWQYKPYKELLEEMKRLNDNVYHLIDYFDSH